MSHSPNSPNGHMPTTQWSLIARLKSQDTAEAHTALDDLCRAYHYPLYCQLRRTGLPHHDAEDVLHDFLAKLLRHDSFGLAESDKGLLRSFLLVALRRFLSNWRRNNRLHNERVVSTETLGAMAGVETRFELDESAHQESPDRLYDRQWAQELMNQVMLRLQARFESRGKGLAFEILRPVLLSGGSLSDHDSAALAARLNMKPGALRTMLLRLLQDYREVLRHEILQTVQNREEAKAEFEFLMACFRKD